MFRRLSAEVGVGWILKNEQLEPFSPLIFLTHNLRLYSTMADIPTFHNLSLERHGNVFVLTMQKPPENRLNSTYCQEMIRAYRTVERLLGPDSEGAVITRGNDAKFWCTVCTNRRLSYKVRRGASYPFLLLGP